MNNLTDNGNDNLTDNKAQRDKKGWFLKGNKIHTPRRKRSDIEALRIALKKEGKNLTPSQAFWDRVAEMAYKDPRIMQAVMNKLTPNKSELDAKITGEQNTIVYCFNHYKACPLSNTGECPMGEKADMLNEIEYGRIGKGWNEDQKAYAVKQLPDKQKEGLKKLSDKEREEFKKVLENRPMRKKEAEKMERYSNYSKMIEADKKELSEQK
jgi:hypothetical protein